MEKKHEKGSQDSLCAWTTFSRSTSLRARKVLDHWIELLGPYKMMTRGSGWNRCLDRHVESIPRCFTKFCPDLQRQGEQIASNVASPTFWEGPNILTSMEEQYFVCETASLSTKRHALLEIWGHGSLHPAGCAYASGEWVTMVRGWG